MAHDEPRNGTSFTTTLKLIVDDIRELFREEVALARAEVRHELSAYSRAAMVIGVGAVAGWFALMLVLFGIAQGVAAAMEWPIWAGYLGLGVLLGLVSVAALLGGRTLMQRRPGVPEQTVASLKETKEWMQDRMRSETR